MLQADTREFTVSSPNVAMNRACDVPYVVEPLAGASPDHGRLPLIHAIHAAGAGRRQQSAASAGMSGCRGPCRAQACRLSTRAAASAATPTHRRETAQGAGRPYQGHFPIARFLVSDEIPSGYKLEGILHAIRAYVTVRCARIMDDPKDEARHVLDNNMEKLNLLSQAIVRAEVSTKVPAKSFGPGRSAKGGPPRIGGA